MEYSLTNPGAQGVCHLTKTPLQTTPTFVAPQKKRSWPLLKVRVKLSDFTTSVLDFTSFTRLRNFQAAFKGRGWVKLEGCRPWDRFVRDINGLWLTYIQHKHQPFMWVNILYYTWMVNGLGFLWLVQLSSPINGIYWVEITYCTLLTFDLLTSKLGIQVGFCPRRGVIFPLKKKGHPNNWPFQEVLKPWPNFGARWIFLVTWNQSRTNIFLQPFRDQK